jgi:hypothetical protein
MSHKDPQPSCCCPKCGYCSKPARVEYISIGQPYAPPVPPNPWCYPPVIITTTTNDFALVDGQGG